MLWKFVCHCLLSGLNGVLILPLLGVMSVVYLDAAEGKTERETLPCDIHRMFEGDYRRGYREGFYHGNEQPEF